MTLVTLVIVGSPVGSPVGLRLAQAGSGCTVRYDAEIIDFDFGSVQVSY